ncbi:MAG: glucuronate isomerase [Anaerolineales bacterium]|nr:glucuronate isomerase [Anaerolineales bacterium]
MTAPPKEFQKKHLPEDRYFGPDPAQKGIARELYVQIRDLSLLCPHGHVDPRMFADPDYSFGTPADLLIIPDHYVYRMLYSQGIPLESLGVPRLDGGPVEKDHRKIWQTFAENFHLFRGTPSGMWLKHELAEVFGVPEKLNGGSAQAVYDQIAARLATPEFRPRRMFERFRIEVLATTDGAADPLEHHRALRDSGWPGRVIPTFRPDDILHIGSPAWKKNVEALGARCGFDIGGCADLIRALEDRRAFFKSMGATATDQAAQTAYTERLSGAEAEAVFRRAWKGEATEADAVRFAGHLALESARMSIEDGLVMQFHVGACRNHNPLVAGRFGRDKGADIPVRSEFTEALRPLLERHGNDPRLTLILFTLDESAYTRELAPIAGHYPAVKLGPAWWFHDSLNGMTRYREWVTETAGLWNTAGFNDDTRAFPSIPARHDLSRRVDANWIAGLVVRGIVDREDAQEMIRDTAYRLAKKAYRF